MVGYKIHEFGSSYMSFVGEKWQNLSFLGRTCTLVPVSKVGTGTHSTEGNWYRYQKLGYRYLFTKEGLVPVSNKGVLVPMLPATLFLHTLHY